MADGNLGPASIPARDEAPYRVTAIEHRTPAIAEMWLRPVDHPMDYRPGEYVLLEDSARQIPPRSYSIANAPRPDGLISLLITRVAAGTTSAWVHDHLRRGDEVTVTGPYGTFVADPSSTAPCLYLAAGSGRAPIRALIEAALAAAPPRPLTLIPGYRRRARSSMTRQTSTWCLPRSPADSRGLGTRGLTGLRSRLLGSVSSAVVHHTDRPTLIFRQAGQS